MTGRRSPLAGVLDGAEGVREIAFATQVGVRLHPGDGGERIHGALGFALPRLPNTVEGDGERRALWLGPDEWLLVGPPEEDLEARLAAALPRELGSVVDVSANRALIELGGPQARDVLAKGCALDLHPRAFSPGRCAQTLLARANVILEQTAPETYLLYVRPSFAGYVAAWLLDASTPSRFNAALRQRSVRATSLNV